MGRHSHIAQSHTRGHRPFIATSYITHHTSYIVIHHIQYKHLDTNSFIATPKNGATHLSRNTKGTPPALLQLILTDVKEKITLIGRKIE